ncbi:hypothetical protein ILYODFUR_009341 [Ilyodon furcidens]|uniref:Uncharacterized protein n=1 Tax=Ilyodon furcidens TaxID=33524 RepID=A0ABV0URI4_9TELE
MQCSLSLPCSVRLKWTSVQPIDVHSASPIQPPRVRKVTSGAAGVQLADSHTSRRKTSLAYYDMVIYLN